jgi:hypothetical protein
MKTLKLTFLIILIAFNCKAGDSTFVSFNKPSEFLFVELTDEFGGTVFRNYKEDGYIDLVLTTEGHVNGKVHFYNPDQIQDFRIAFVPGNRDPEMKDWIVRVSSPKIDLINGEVDFGVMEKDRFSLLSTKYKTFTMILVYKKTGEIIGGNEISVGE